MLEATSSGGGLTLADRTCQTTSKVAIAARSVPLPSLRPCFVPVHALDYGFVHDVFLYVVCSFCLLVVHLTRVQPLHFALISSVSSLRKRAPRETIFIVLNITQPIVLYTGEPKI